MTGGFYTGILCLFFLFSGAAYGDTIEIVTDRGNVFVLNNAADFNANATNGADGTSMIDGLGINSRLVHQEYGGSMMYGSGLAGVEDSIKPYNPVHADSKFIVAMLDSDNTRTITIPEFYQTYEYDGTLDRTSGESPNILGYSHARKLDGNAQVGSNPTDGITVSGQGRTVVKLSSYSGQTLILDGELSEGTTIRLVQSPYDLTGLEYDQTRGFLLNYCACNPGTDTFSILAGTADDSQKSAIFQYDQSVSASVYHGKCCKGKYTVSGGATRTIDAHPVIRTHESGYHEITGDTAGTALMNVRDVMRHGAKLFRINYNIVDDFRHWTYDTLPVKESRNALSGTFEVQFTFPQGQSYMVIDSAGGTSNMRGIILGEQSFIDIQNLEPDTGYRLVRDDHTVFLGMTSQTGRIHLSPFEDQVFLGKSGQIYLYENSLTYQNRQDAVNTRAFDHMNHVILDLPFPKDQAYNIHAYVKIPIVGDVRISNVGLDGSDPSLYNDGRNFDGSLTLGYLDGEYSDGQSLFVPIIPTFKQIRLTINEIPTYLNIADVLGGTGLHIADPVSSTITKSRPDGFIHSIEATAGAITYMIATIDGNAKANIQATIYGESTITNTRKYLELPPPPPPPLPRDPLSAWVEVYINGELQTIGGNSATQIFFSDQPVEDHDSGRTGTTAHHTAGFAYPAVTVLDTISIPVQEADFVEFYFYGRIYAEGSIPPVPSGYEEYRRSSDASATVTIRYAGINTSM